jgi:hypothetical protein
MNYDEGVSFYIKIRQHFVLLIFITLEIASDLVAFASAVSNWGASFWLNVAVILNF